MRPIDIRENNRKRTLENSFPGISYYLGAKKLFIYKNTELNPRMTFTRTETGYVLGDTHLSSITACVHFAAISKEFQN